MKKSRRLSLTDMTDDEAIETSIAGVIEAVILRRLAMVQRQTAADITSWSPWAFIGRFGLQVAASVNELFATTLDSGTSLAAISRQQGREVECAHCGVESAAQSAVYARSRRRGTEDCCDDDR